MTKMTYIEESMSKAMTIAEAKSRFSDCVRSAEGGETVLITRYGKPAAAVVSAKYLAELESLRRKGPARQGLAALIERFSDGEEFAAEAEQVVRERGAPRKTPALR
jgi:prevent-host-death family protein